MGGGLVYNGAAVASGEPGGVDLNFDVGVRVVSFTEELQHDRRVGRL